MKYKLFKKAETAEEIDSVLLNILANTADFSYDSILETDDRFIVRYVKRTLEVGIQVTQKIEAIFYIHYSKKGRIFTKICIYKLEEAAE